MESVEQITAGRFVACAKCGRSIGAGKKFCPNCGESVATADPILSVQSQAQASAPQESTDSPAASQPLHSYAAIQSPPPKGGINKAFVGGAIAAALFASAGAGGYWYYQKQETEKAVAAEMQRAEEARVRAKKQAEAEAERVKAETQQALAKAEVEKAKAQAAIAKAEAEKAIAQSKATIAALKSQRAQSQQPAQENCKVFLINELSMTIVTPYKGGCKDGLANGRGTYEYSNRFGNGASSVSTVNGEFRSGRLNGNATLTHVYSRGGSSNASGEFRENRPWNVITNVVPPSGAGAPHQTRYREGIFVK